ncbi:MAG TPA: hypothetical protein VH394_28065 [Thermoanaerobaculia bacterium]|jgi:hypothetical protein|nr:hypothetical protein [Thermoanaerobaculia bacterium]
MFRAKWVMVVVLLAVASIPASASEIRPIQTVPAVLHLPGPDEPPLYTDIEFAKAPVLPGNLCEARCLTDFRDFDVLLDACMASCVSEI